MDARDFDAAARTFAAAGTRRGLLRLLPALPILGALATLLGAGTSAKDRRQRSKDRHNDKQHRRSGHRDKARRRKQQQHARERARNRRTPKPQPVPPAPCVPDSPAQTCAGKCATVPNNCGQAVNCGPCVCSPACPLCQTCDEATGQCTNLADGTACGTNLVCVGGTCACTVTSCATGCCQGDVCHIDEDGACGTNGGVCQDCTTLNQLCGGGGIPGACGCESDAEACAGQTCDTVVNNCGQTVPCTGCPGCCIGPSCQSGQTDRIACGSGGNDCQPCPGVCDAGVCVACSGTAPCPGDLCCDGGVCVISCPSGCCADGQCVVSCPTCQTCNGSGRCIAEPDGTACGPGGSNAHCCQGGVCTPPLTCLPFGTTCGTAAECVRDCCSQRSSTTSGCDAAASCTCANNFPGAPCGSVADCASGPGVECRCGTCCCTACGPNPPCNPGLCVTCPA